jgi:hypothetical protein
LGDSPLPRGLGGFVEKKVDYYGLTNPSLKTSRTSLIQKNLLYRLISRLSGKRFAVLRVPPNYFVPK